MNRPIPVYDYTGTAAPGLLGGGGGGGVQTHRDLIVQELLQALMSQRASRSTPSYSQLVEGGAPDLPARAGRSLQGLGRSIRPDVTSQNPLGRMAALPGQLSANTADFWGSLLQMREPQISGMTDAVTESIMGAIDDPQKALSRIGAAITQDDMPLKLAESLQLGDVTGLGAAASGLLKRASKAKLPDPSASQKTQRANTLGTYIKADNLLNKIHPQGKTLDYGAGLGLSRTELGYDTLEPNPREGFVPDYESSKKIKTNSYPRLVSLSVLNVVGKKDRDKIVSEIGRVLSPGGTAIVTARTPNAVLTALPSGSVGPEKSSVITRDGTYQKGFTQKELIDYLQESLGKDFSVVSIGSSLSGSGAMITKISQPKDTLKTLAKADDTKSLFDVTPQVHKKTLSNPSVRRREAFREGGETIIDKLPPISRTTLQPEDLEGMVGVPFMADRSRAGGELTQVGGVPLDRPVPLQGGEDYPIIIQPGAAWASNRGIARNKLNNVISAFEETNKSPVGVFTVMGERGVDFSTPVIESMVGQLDAIGIPQKSIKTFDTKVNAEIDKFNKDRKEGTKEMPHFVGLDHPDALDQLLGIKDYPRHGSGNLRKLLVQLMFGTEFRNIGFPVYHDVLKAVTKPELMRLNRGDAGTTMFKVDPHGKLSDEGGVPSLHRSYDTAIPGSYLGGLEEAVPPRIMFPKTFENLDKLLTKPKDKKTKPRPYTHQEKIGALGAAHHWEVFDSEWVDKVSEWVDHIKKVKGESGGGSSAAMVLAPLFFGAGQLEQWIGEEDRPPSNGNRDTLKTLARAAND
tara:strand:- start:20941 stop:23340 length:2400 start_codon:yes stop_codon:yes gene_type:complete